MLTISDPNRRLSRNPRNWPEALKQAIADCCCEGSGSGSGSGSGPEKIACCTDALASLISWEITGTTGAAACVTGTEVPTANECLIENDDQNGFRCGPASAVGNVAGYTETCVVGAATTNITISLCCAEPEEGDPFYPSRYRLAVYLSVTEGATTLLAQWCTEEFDIGSCDPLHIEVINLVPLYDDFGGALLNLVVT